MVRSLTNARVETPLCAARRVRPLTAVLLFVLFLAIVPAVCSQETGNAAGEAVDSNQALTRGSDSLLAVLNGRPVLPPVAKHGLGHKRSKTLDPKLDVSRIGDRKVDGGLNFYSMEREQELGRELAREIDQGSTLVTDPVITEYVSRVGQTIATNSDAKVPFTIKVVDDDEINAYALPGGFLYINTGLLLEVDNEAELASVMAHEIAHVAARHTTRNSTRAELFNMASIPLALFGGPAVFAAREVLDVAGPLAMLKFTRNAEREADLLGLEYCYKAGYDPQAFITFFEKLNTTGKKKHNLLAKTFASHPMTEDRIRSAQQEIAQALPPLAEYIVDTSDFAQMKQRVIQREQDSERDNGQDLKPTLRRRTQEPVDPSVGDDGPALKKSPADPPR